MLVRKKSDFHRMLAMKDPILFINANKYLCLSGNGKFLNE